MRSIVLNNGKIIGDGNGPYIIAEMNSSHKGNIGIAKKMIDSAIECGCDCVKFQSWSEKSLYSEQYYAENPMSKRFVKRFSLSNEQLQELSNYCNERGVNFSSTPYSNEEVDFLVDVLKVPFVKIASMEINNLNYLQYIARKGIPMVISTGMATESEIREAIDTIKNTGNEKFCILHCVSVYPVEPQYVNLNNITMLRDKYNEYPVGYSDHTIGYEVAAAAVSLGASVIEKHFTLDNTIMGMDNNMATEPTEMKNLVSACHNVYAALGLYNRCLDEYELEQQKKMRRSLVAKRDLMKGEIISEEDVEAKRPGDGLSPVLLKNVLNKTLKSDVAKGYQIRMENIEMEEK